MKKNINDGISRICSCCGRILPLDDFHKNKNQKFGRAYCCKDCVSNKYKEKYDRIRKVHNVDSLPGEEWKAIPGFFGYYQVSNKGRVCSVGRVVNGRNIYPRIMKQCESRGYLIVKLRKDGQTITCPVHILLAESFLDRPEGLVEVNHKNGIRNDNRLENIEWCTRQYNIWHSYYVNKRKPSGCKPVMCVENEKIYPSCLAASRDLGIDNSSIACVANGKYKQVKGYHFKFINE